MDYTDSFRLFCTTRLPNPHYTPELSAKVTLVDFTVTMAGLEDQLLGKLILKEKHELEEQRQGLMEEVQSYKKKIKQLEDDLLFRLSNSQVSVCIIPVSATCLEHEAGPFIMASVALDNPMHLESCAVVWLLTAPLLEVVPAHVCFVVLAVARQSDLVSAASEQAAS